MKMRAFLLGVGIFGGLGLGSIGAYLALPDLHSTVVRAKGKPEQPKADLVVTAQTKVAKEIDLALKLEDFSGSMLVVQDGKVVLHRGYDYLDYTNETPNHPRTYFPLASITKNVTAVMVMKVLAEKQGSVDDPISKYLPDLPGGADVTIKDLLTMHGGYNTDTGGYAPKQKRLSDYNQYYATHMTAPMLAPSQLGRYNAHDYQVLELFLQATTGLDYDKRLARYLPDYDLVTYAKFAKQPDQVQGWRKKAPGTPLKAYIFDREPGTGNVFATTTSLYALLRDQIQGKLLTKQQFADMTTPLNDKKYGGGMYTARDLKGYKVHGWFLGECLEAGGFISDDGRQAILFFGNQVDPDDNKVNMRNVEEHFKKLQQLV